MVREFADEIFGDKKEVDYKPELHNWIGPMTEFRLSDTGKVVTFGPTPPGILSDLEAILLIVFLKKLMDKPDGAKIIRDIANEYLQTLGKIISTLSQSSSAHVISCAMNQYVACSIYQRLGLMSPHDATETRAWLDHQTGEAMTTERAGFSLGALTTLVNTVASAETPQAIAAYAKILGQ